MEGGLGALGDNGLLGSPHLVRQEFAKKAPRPRHTTWRVKIVGDKPLKLLTVHIVGLVNEPAN
jgi:hypothetical protein